MGEFSRSSVNLHWLNVWALERMIFLAEFGGRKTVIRRGVLIKDINMTAWFIPLIDKAWLMVLFTLKLGIIAWLREEPATELLTYIITVNSLCFMA
jgi:hypothetical protein